MMKKQAQGLNRFGDPSYQSPMQAFLGKVSPKAARPKAKPAARKESRR